MSRAAAEFVLIRHATARSEGRLCGRTDIACEIPGGEELAAIRARVGDVRDILTSPALRCRQTASALWPDRDFARDDRLWEQDFGTWEGKAYAELPDLGVLAAAELAAHRPPGGESFADVAARIRPVLDELEGSMALVVHAGVIRAAIAMVVGAPAALAFDIAPLSVSRISRLGNGAYAIAGTNWRPA